MKNTFKAIVVSFLCCSAAYADAGFTPNEVKLNQQLQDQIKSVQTQQQQQLAALNTQIQAQIQQVQTDLQKQIQTANTQIQGQLKQLQAQINKKN